jgi:hypothetical protein
MLKYRSRNEKNNVIYFYIDISDYQTTFFSLLLLILVLMKTLNVIFLLDSYQNHRIIGALIVYYYPMSKREEAFI